MPNNIRKTSDLYVTKAGTDGALPLGTTKDTPLKTAGGLFTVFATNDSAVFGTGVYKEAVSTTRVFNIIESDGIVVFKGDGSNTFTINSSNFSEVLRGFIFENYTEVQTQYVKIIEDCVFKCDADLKNTDSEANNCVFEGSNVNNSLFPTLGRLLLNGCTLINSSLENARGFVGSYCDSGSTLNFRTEVLTAANLSESNIQGIVISNGVQYELKKEKDGTAIDPNPAIADIVSVYADVYTNGNFSEDPVYLNLSKSDYCSLDASSPNLKAADGGSGNIGTHTFSAILRTATEIPPNDELSGGTLADLVASLGDYIVDGVAANGTVTTKPLKVADLREVLQTMSFAIALNFDSDETKGTVENDNVMATTVYGIGTAGANPQRLTYEMRFSTQVTEPIIASEWDNLNYFTPGDYGVFSLDSIFGSTPKVDIAGLGTGDPLYNSAVSGQLAAIYVQLRITLQAGIEIV